MDPADASVERAYSHVKAGLDRGDWFGTGLLPTLRDLSRCAHVSSAAMSIAIGRFTAEGLLVASRKGGIRIAGHTQAPTGSRRKWQGVRTTIEKDILDGRFKHGELLPGSAQLQERYGIGYNTLKKAIDTLVKENVVVAHKRSYLVPETRRVHARAAILFIGADDGTGRLALIYERFMGFSRTLNRESIAAGAEIVAFPCGARSEGFAALRRRLLAAQKKSIFIGYFIWANGIDPHTVHHVLQELAPLNRPVAVIDETGAFRMPEALAAAPSIKVFTIAGASAGQAVANFLLRLGHRKIAFFSPFHREIWSRLRLQGMLDAFARVGLSGGIAIRTIDTFDTPVYPDPGPESDPVLQKFKDILLFTDSLIAAEPFPAIHLELYELQACVMGLLRNKRELTQLTPFLDRIASDPDISALVGVNDYSCVLATQYCAHKGIVVPSRLSIIGFDDSTMAYKYGISSYNFGFSDIAHLIVSYIINPAQHSRFYKGTTVECEGVIMERESTCARKFGSPQIRSPRS
jgi:hypothetical protein